MHHSTNMNKPGKTRSLTRQSGWFLAAFSLVIAAGCSPPERVPDPMKGEIHPQQNANNITYGPTLAPANQGHNTAVPPSPSNDGSVSTMALASMSGSRPLAIGVSQTSTSAFSPAPTVQAVQPDPPAVIGSFSAIKQTHDILQEQLRYRGVEWQQQEAVPEGVKFTCIVRNRNSTENSKIYESTARDYVSAVQAVLLQIDKN